jgi:hypothetical protein
MCVCVRRHAQGHTRAVPAESAPLPRLAAISPLATAAPGDVVRPSNPSLSCLLIYHSVAGMVHLAKPVGHARAIHTRALLVTRHAHAAMPKPLLLLLLLLRLPAAHPLARTRTQTHVYICQTLPMHACVLTGGGAILGAAARERGGGGRRRWW